MELYAADLFESGKPVKKQKRTKKPVPDVESDIELPKDDKPVKEKKPRSAAQIAAFEKAKETRRLKKEATAKEAEQKAKLEQEASASELRKAEALAAKKEAAADKRRIAREKKKQQVTQEASPSEESVDVSMVVEEKPKQKRKRGEDEPPAWFHKFVQSAKTETNAQLPIQAPPKQVRQEAKAQAKTAWADPLVRDRVSDEMERHLTGMYSQIFAGRKL